MYIYFDKRGVLKEIIEGTPTRMGNYGVNTICAYFEDESITGATFLSSVQNSVEAIVNDTTSITFTDDENASGIYVGDVSLKYFKTYKTYNFYVYQMAQLDVSVAGLNKMTVRGFDASNNILAMGELIYNVEDNIIQADESIGQNEYDYLIARIGNLATVTSLINEITNRINADNALLAKQIKNAGLTTTLLNGIVTTQLTRNDNTGLQDTFDLNDFTYSKSNLYTKSESDARFLNADYSYSKAETNALLDDKVDKAVGYGLMSDSEKTKLSGIESGAEVNVIETVKVNGTALIPDEKAVDVSVPTAYALTPNMDGVASSGSSTSFAKGDHTHPTDTSRLAINPNGTDNLLDSNNKINTTYIPDTLLGQVSFKGTWNANSNTSQIVGTLSDGNYYICSAGGRYNPDGTDTGTANYYGVGDWAIYHTGTGWDKVANTDAVTMVNSQIGSIETYKGSWATNTQYYKGDTIQYNNELYLCLTTHTSSTTFDATKFKIFNESELYYCTYGTTTFAEITSALSSGKLPVCIYNDRAYTFASYTSSTYIFSSAQSDYLRYATVNDSNVWAVSVYNIEIKANMVTSLSNSSTDTQYPSAKCVYNELATKQNTLTAGSNIQINNNTISATDTTYSLATTSSAGLMPRLASSSVSTQTQSTKFLREDGSWQAPSYTTAKSADNTTIEDNSNVLSVKAFPLTTSAPSSDNTSGVLNIVKLSEKPQTMYSGYIYMVETSAPAGYTVTLTTHSMYGDPYGVTYAVNGGEAVEITSNGTTILNNVSTITLSCGWVCDRCNYNLNNTGDVSFRGQTVTLTITEDSTLHIEFEED